MTEYKITRDEILRRAYTQYPYFHRGLEIECKDGQRILTARKRGLRLFGYSTEEYKTAWVVQGIDAYCKKGESLDNLPYDDDLFDLVIVPNALDYVNLDELYRVGNRLFYLKTKPGWLDKVLKLPWKLEVYQKSLVGNEIFECRK